ncbi:MULTISPECIES: hypothetical protein [unclassified Sphingobium]|uniref:hypothetical protein n=1 Tax=unclassified Sphingobium TaxID=2611147 RepID=UPI00129052ED|nr:MULTISPECIES: hypothetical protein [unclassified Sphingobium]
MTQDIMLSFLGASSRMGFAIASNFLDAGSSVTIGSRCHCPLPDPPAEGGATFIVVDREHPGEQARIPI